MLKIVNMAPKQTYREATNRSGRVGSRLRYLAIATSPNGMISAQTHTIIRFGTISVKFNNEGMLRTPRAKNQLTPWTDTLRLFLCPETKNPGSTGSGTFRLPE